MKLALFFTLLYLCFTSSTIFSCKPHEDDFEKPLILVSSPSLNDTILLSFQDIVLDFVVSENDEIHDIIVSLTNNEGNIIYYKKIHDDVQTYHFNERFKPSNINKTTPIILTIEASDHSSNKDIKTINFTVSP